MEDLATLRDAIGAALARGDAEGAFSLLPAPEAVAAGDAALALTWLETVRVLPSFPASFLLSSVQKIAKSFTESDEVGLAACATLVATSSRRPIDSPPTGDPLAAEALAIAERLASRDLAPELVPYVQINLANALRLSTRARDDEARRAFGAAIEARPDEASFHFDRGLFHKSRGELEAAHDAFARARELGRSDRPLSFNLAVTATGLGRGEDARRAWSGLGIGVEVNEAGMPIARGLDSVELRVPTRGSGHEIGADVPDDAMTFEVVSVAPLSPCHGVVETPTLRDAPVDYGDVVLWDGVPVGRRELRGSDGATRVVPRFALLEIMRRGDERRMRFVALEQREGDAEALNEALPDGARLFVLAARVESVCPRCAAGEVLTKHAHAPAEEHRIVRGKLVAEADVDLATLARALENAVAAKGAVSLAVPALYEALGDAKRAGREHQAYRGIERVGLRKGLG
jgi:hypothetical protein